jgi:cytoskeletal protein CcmA (bactofilin family)
MKNLNRVFLLLLATFAFSFFAFMSAVQSQTNYYTTDNGDWDDSDNWTPSKPGDDVESGDSVFVLHNMDLDSDMDIEGVLIIQSGGEVSGDEEIKVEEDGFLINRGTFSTTKELKVEEDGNLTNSGTLSLSDDLKIEGAMTNSGTITVGNDLKVEGEMTNSGIITVSDDVEVEGEMTNNGTLSVADKLEIDGDFYNTSTITTKKLHIDNYLNNTGLITVDDNEKVALHGGTIDGGGSIITSEIEMTENDGVEPSLSNINVCDENGDDPVIDRQSGIIDSATVIVCGLALPVELYTYEVTLDNNNVRIDWATASELNNDYFIVERSIDAYHFEEIAREDGSGNSDAFRYYAVTDRFPFEGVSYYRLKQVDFDGTTTYFDIKMVDNKNGYTDEYGLTVYPNPIMEHSKFNIGLEGFDGNTVQVKIQNMSGFLVYSSEVSVSQERELIELNTNIIQDSGMYVVSVFSGNRWYHHKFMFVK